MDGKGAQSYESPAGWDAVARPAPACSARGEGFKPAPPTVLCDCPQFGANKLLEQFFTGLDVSYINKITHFSLESKGEAGLLILFTSRHNAKI